MHPLLLDRQMKTGSVAQADLIEMSKIAPRAGAGRAVYEKLFQIRALTQLIVFLPVFHTDVLRAAAQIHSPFPVSYTHLTLPTTPYV